MASSLSFSPVCSFSSTNNQGIFIGNSATGKAVRVNQLFQNTNKTPKFQTLEVKASESTPAPAKVNSIVCHDCEGNGAILCTQCKGEGVNITDHFNGQFKAGALCWLCRGKREILCGNCNGAGFVGGFMSTADS